MRPHHMRSSEWGVSEPSRNVCRDWQAMQQAAAETVSGTGYVGYKGT